MTARRNGPLSRTLAVVAVLAALGGGCQLVDSTEGAGTASDGEALAEGSEGSGSEGRSSEGRSSEAEGPVGEGDGAGGDGDGGDGDGGDPMDEGSEPDSPGGGDEGEVPADLRACTGAEADAISEVIGFQLEAFVASDFPAALSWATPGFRRSFTPQAFEEMITSSFPVPASATGHRVLDCTVSGEAAMTTVSIDGAGATQDFSYGLQLLDEGWRIDGAVPLEDVQPPAEVV